MQIVREPIAIATLKQMTERMFGNLVKAVVDTEPGHHGDRRGDACR